MPKSFPNNVRNSPQNSRGSQEVSFFDLEMVSLRASHYFSLPPKKQAQIQEVFSAPGEWNAMRDAIVCANGQGNLKNAASCVATTLAHPQVQRLMESGNAYKLIRFPWDSKTVLSTTLDWVCESGSIVKFLFGAPQEPKELRSYLAFHHWDARLAFDWDIAQGAGLAPEACYLVTTGLFAPVVVVFQLSGPTLCAGRKKYQKDLQTYLRCQESGDWPGYPCMMTI